MEGESIEESVLKKRRGSYLSYLSNPSLKVPKTSKHRQKLSKEDLHCPSSENKASGSSCQTEHVDSSYCDQSEDICLENCESFDLLEGFLPQKETEVGAQDQLTDGSSVTTTDNKLFCSGFREDGCSDTYTPPQVQDFCDDPALGAGQISEDWDENRMDEQLETDENDSQDSFVKITELSSSRDSPLYAGSPVTFSVSLLLIITFAMRHNLTGLALADLLTLINVHLLVPNCFAKSTAVLNCFFRQLKKPIEYHYYCSFCYQYIGLKKISCCSNKYCSTDFSKKGALSYFIVLPLAVQLHSLLASMYYYMLMIDINIYMHVINNTW